MGFMPRPHRAPGTVKTRRAMEPTSTAVLAARLHDISAVRVLIYDAEDKGCPREKCVLCWSRRSATGSGDNARMRCYSCGASICSLDDTGMGGCDRCWYGMDYIAKWIARQSEEDRKELLAVKDDDTALIVKAVQLLTRRDPNSVPATHAVETCMVCFERPPDTFVKPCIHQVCCRECSDRLKETANATLCIMCRGKIESVSITRE